MTERSRPVRSPASEGVLDAIRGPLWVLAVGYVGFGSLAHATGMHIVNMVLSTLCLWALPGQIILVEMMALKASAVAIVIAVVASAFRFLPMTVSLIPLMKPQGVTWRHYALAQFLALSAWTVAMQRFPSMPMERRFGYVAGFACTMVAGCLIGSLIGYALSGQMPKPVTLAFVLSNPLFFMLMLMPLINDNMLRWAVAFGAMVGPLAFLVSPDWSIAVAGVVGGTVAFWVGERKRSATRESLKGLRS